MSKLRPTATEFAGSSYDPVLEKRFFRDIRLHNQMLKETDCHRLDDVNDAVLPFLRAVHERPLRILDVGASSGIIAQEWSDQLLNSGIEAHITGTDICLEVNHLRCGFFEALLDRGQNVIHLAILGRAVSIRETLYQKPFVLASKAIVRALGFCGVNAPRLRLVSKALRTVHLVEEDIEADNENQRGYFHVIRAANILNALYFSTSKLVDLVRAILRRLRPGGLLVVARTHDDGTNHATIFRLEDDRLTVVARLGRGYEMESLLLGDVSDLRLLHPPRRA